jgi:predicted ATPase
VSNRNSIRYTSSTASKAPIEAYEELVKSGKIVKDEYQITTVLQLQKLYEDILKYEPSSGTTAPPQQPPAKSFFSGLFSSTSNHDSDASNMSSNSNSSAPKGIYIWGGVGCGMIHILLCIWLISNMLTHYLCYGCFYRQNIHDGYILRLSSNKKKTKITF